MTTPAITNGSSVARNVGTELRDVVEQLRSDDPPARNDVADYIEALIPLYRPLLRVDAAPVASRDLVRRGRLAPPPLYTGPTVPTSLDVVRAAEARAAPLAEAMAAVDRAIFRDNNPHAVDTVAPVRHAPTNRPDLEPDLLEMGIYLWGEYRRPGQFMAFGPYGRSQRTLYAWPEGGRVATGCFEGTIQEFREAVGRTYGDQIGNLRSYIASEAERPQAWDYVAVARLMHQRAEYLAIADLIDKLRLSRLQHPEV